jgi:hypothetical protein
MNNEVAIGTTLILGLFYCWTSRINGLFFFGRTADAELRSSEAGRAITRQYLTSILLTTLAAAALAWQAGRHSRPSIAAATLLLEVVAFSAIFARANGEVRRIAHATALQSREPVVEAPLLQPLSYWIPGVSAILLPILLCLAALGAAVLSAAHGAGLRAGGTAFSDAVDRLGDSFLLGMATGMLASSSGILLIFRISARLRTRMAQYMVRSMFSLEWIASLLLIAVLISNRLGILISHRTEKSILAVAISAALAMAVWNQSRSRRFALPPVELGGDDRWRWGLFYVDTSDPALFVQSRCGAGYTLNFGRFAAWPISVGLVAYLVGVLFFLPHHR